MSIQFIQTSPEQLSELISKNLVEHIQEIKKSIPHPEQLLTREQVAELLDIDLSTLWHWTKAGRLKSYGIANRIYFKRSEIEQALIPINS